MLNPTIRALAFILGGLIFLGGLAELGVPGGDAGAGVWAILIGAAIMVAAVLQRSRYRSDSAERDHTDPGPGGGEMGSMEPRFLATTEIFMDPTSHHLMRVYVDPRTGERRYRAES
ncbi:MAG: hypothetical protein ACHQ01_03950 [Candidatus Limnocylindrales bacterium]